MADPLTDKISPTEGEEDAADNSNDWKVQRDEEKSCGDNAFRARDFATAIHHYTAALSLDPTNHILLSNRSAAYLSSQQKSRALHDAQACVEHAPPDYVKGYSRLGAALQSLGRYEPAKDAWEKVLQADDKNAAAQQGLEKAKEAIKAQEPAAAASAGATETKDGKEADDEEDDLDDFFNGNFFCCVSFIFSHFFSLLDFCLTSLNYIIFCLKTLCRRRDRCH